MKQSPRFIHFPTRQLFQPSCDVAVPPRSWTFNHLACHSCRWAFSSTMWLYVHHVVIYQPCGYISTMWLPQCTSLIVIFQAVPRGCGRENVEASIFGSCHWHSCFVSCSSTCRPLRLDRADRVRPLRLVAHTGSNTESAGEACAHAAAYFKDCGRCAHDLLAQSSRALAH